MTDPMTTERLDEIEARADAATDGPWEAWDRGIGFEVHVDGEGLNSEFRETFQQADAEFIAAARTDVPQLVTALRAVLNLADWHETKAEKARRFPGGPSSIGEAEAKARVHDDAARRIRTAITDNLMEDHDE